MAIKDWQTITRLFSEAVDLPVPERSAFLDRACGVDLELRREIESLLTHDTEETLLGAAVGSAALSIEAGRMEGKRVGRYEIVSLIGHGGMGSVYLAERADGEFHHRVAVKIIHGGLKNGSAIVQFRHERQILARLTHPHIARLLDGGATEDGRPYFVMEYVEGTPIDVHCLNLTIRQRVELFRLVCEAVEYAHQNLTVHRDIKPGNVLVTPGGEPKLLDFGIAKVLEKDMGTLGQTVTSAGAMTPEYASPEQVRGESVTTATDVYGLGALLYTLLTGAKPHVFKNGAPGEIERVVCVEEPRRLSEHSRELAGDLEAIVMKAMRKEPAERYRSVEQFSADLGRYLQSAPVEARRNLFTYRAGKFIQRNRLLVAASTIAVIALGVGTGLAIWQGRRAERRFHQVRGLAHSFLFDIEATLGKVPGSTKSRQMIVRTALSYLENLAQDSRGDVSLQRELASAYEKVGDMQGNVTGPNLGDTKGALESYQKGQELRRSFGAHQSKDPATRREYLLGQLKVADTEERLGQITAAAAVAREVASDADSLSAAYPTDIGFLTVASRAHNELGSLETRGGDLKHSLAERMLALDVSRRIAAAQHNDVASQRSVAAALQGVGLTFDRMGQRAESEKYYLEALGIYKGLVAGDPLDQALRRHVMIFSTLAGSDEWVQKHYEQAYKLQNEAFTIAEAALAADPSNAQALMDDLAICQRFGDLLFDMKKVDEGTRLFERALSYSERLVQIDPENREARLNYGLAMGRIAAMHQKRNDLGAAIAWRRKASHLFEELDRRFGGDKKTLNPLMFNYMMLGEWLDQTGDRATAEVYHRKALAIGEKILGADPLEKEIGQRVTKISARLAGKTPIAP